MDNNRSYILIESLLKELCRAAERGDCQQVESIYSQALIQATTTFGEDRAPLCILLMCKAIWFQNHGELSLAEAFNRRLRDILRSNLSQSIINGGSANNSSGSGTASSPGIDSLP